VLHRGRATVTGIFRTLGKLADRHWTVYHKFFYRAVWSLGELAVQLQVRVIYPMILESGALDPADQRPVVDLNIDDTTVGRYGRHVAHASWFKDASASGPAHKGKVIHWAHNWIVGAVTLRLPRWPLVRWVLPVAFQLYCTVKDRRRIGPFRTRQQLAGQMVQQVAAACPDVHWRVAADGQYATREFVDALPHGVSLVSRIRRDAAIYQLPPDPAKRRGPGKPPKKGPRLPAPRNLAARRKRGWQTITVTHQGRQVPRLVLGITCLWYHVCKDRPIRLLIVRDPAGRQNDDFIFCTDPTIPDQQIVQRFVDRWGVEEAIFEAKQFLGFESARGWCSTTVHHQAPLAMILLSMVKAWFSRAALADPSLLPADTPWRSKTRPSFLDMLAALRGVLWKHRISPKSAPPTKVQDILDAVAYALFAAA